MYQNIFTSKIRELQKLILSMAVAIRVYVIDGTCASRSRLFIRKK